MNDIIFIEQYDNRIKLLSNYCSNQYSFYTASLDKISADGLSIESSKNIDLGSREYVLKTNLDTNYYFSVKKNGTEIESYPLYTGKLTIKEHIDQIIQVYNIDMSNMQKEYREIVKKTETAEWSEIFAQIILLYKKVNGQEKYKIFLLLEGLINRYNYNTEYHNGNFIELCTYDSTLKFNRPIDRAFFCSVADGNRHFIINSYIDDFYKTKTLQDTLYRIYLYNKNKIVSSIYYFEPNNAVKKFIRNDKIYTEEKKREAIENNLFVPSVYVNLTEEEKIFYQFEQLVRPKNIFVKLPNIYEEYPNIKFVFEDIKCLDFIKESSFDYFLVINEEDVLCSSNASRRIKIDLNKNSMLVNIHDYGIRNEAYFYYIEDEKGTVISDVHVFKRDDRSVNIYEDYSLKKKEIQMIEFKKETNTVLNAIKTSEENIGIIRKMIDKIEHDNELSKLDIFSTEVIFIANQYDIMADTVYALSINQTIQSDYDKDICDKLKYSSKERKIALYSKVKSTLFSIIQIGDKNSYEYTETYVLGKQDASIDFKINIDTRICVVRGINLNTNMISGFVLIEYPSKTAKYYAKEYLIELEEVN